MLILGCFLSGVVYFRHADSLRKDHTTICYKILIVWINLANNHQSSCLISYHIRSGTAKSYRLFFVTTSYILSSTNFVIYSLEIILSYLFRICILYYLLQPAKDCNFSTITLRRPYRLGGLFLLSTILRTFSA